jgi:hypothetical protein
MINVVAIMMTQTRMCAPFFEGRLETDGAEKIGAPGSADKGAEESVPFG